MIRFVCACGTQLQVRDENAGQLVRCPSCKESQTVPPLPPVSIQIAEENVEQAAPRAAARRTRPTIREDDEDDRPRRAAPESASGKATVSLVLGILSLFCNVLTGLPALIVGIMAISDIGRSRGRIGGRGLAIGGIISACVGTLISCGVVSLSALPALLIPSVSRVRDAAAQAQSSNNLKQMGLAMHNYNDTNGTLPPSGLGSAQKQAGQKPFLSWRVAILPFIEQQNLYRQFKLDEPWDSPHNIKLLPQMPTIYRLHNDTNTPFDHTHYQVFVGNGAAFEKTRGFKIPQDFPDGTSNTILIAVVERAVPWTKPEDVDFDPNKPMTPLMSSYLRGGFQFALADGSVRLEPSSLSENRLKAAITRDGNEDLRGGW